MSSSRAGAAEARGHLSDLDSWPHPLGHTALDIRAVYAGWTGRPWREVRFEELAHRYLGDRCRTHQALDDALAQADILRGLMAEMAQARPQGTPDAKGDRWFPAW